MEWMYLGMVIFLFVLAAFDLWVGVSNDAVNFLNSAIGSRTAQVPHAAYHCLDWCVLRMYFEQWYDGHCPSRHFHTAVFQFPRGHVHLPGRDGHRHCVARYVQQFRYAHLDHRVDGFRTARSLVCLCHD